MAVGSRKSVLRPWMGEFKGWEASSLRAAKAKLAFLKLTPMVGQPLITLFDPRTYRLHTWYFYEFVPEETPRLEYPYILMPPSSRIPSFQISPPIGPQPTGEPRFRDMIPMAIAGTVAITLGALLEKAFKSPNKAPPVPGPPLLGPPANFPNTPYYGSPYPSQNNLAIRSSSAQKLHGLPGCIATSSLPNLSTKYDRQSTNRADHPRVQELPDDSDEVDGRNGARTKSTPGARTLGNRSKPGHSKSLSQTEASPERNEGVLETRPETLPTSEKHQPPRARSQSLRLDFRLATLPTQSQLRVRNIFAEKIKAQHRRASETNNGAPAKFAISGMSMEEPTQSQLRVRSIFAEKIKAQHRRASENNGGAPSEVANSDMSMKEPLKAKLAKVDKPVVDPLHRFVTDVWKDYDPTPWGSEQATTPDSTKLQDVVLESVPKTIIKLDDTGGSEAIEAIISDSQKSTPRVAPLIATPSPSQPDDALFTGCYHFGDPKSFAWLGNRSRRLRSRNGSATQKQYSAFRTPKLDINFSQPRMARVTALARPFLLDAEAMETAQEETEKTRIADHWIGTLQNRVHEVVERNRKELDPRVKIAIIDTGIDLESPIIKKHQSRIKESKSFIDNAPSDRDICGHGTHAAGLLLDIASNAELYVARVCMTGKEMRGTAERVAKAISWATEECSVDIISMSFGFPQRDDGIRDAIVQAYSKGKLLFAAASNNGANESVSISFPARLNGLVFCVNSTDGHGAPSSFNPPHKDDPHKFSILGEAVKSAWPLNLQKCETGEGETRRSSGTSIATPILAGVAALIVEFARQKPSMIDLKKLMHYDGMLLVLKYMAEEKGGYSYVRPWHLLTYERQRTREDISMLISNELKKI
ncbi:MAG: hypothetical protein Q9222_004268 [Ikaeria aurantiellina]